jgi:hypothetical protein
MVNAAGIDFKKFSELTPSQKEEIKSNIELVIEGQEHNILIALKGSKILGALNASVNKKMARVDVHHIYATTPPSLYKQGGVTVGEALIKELAVRGGVEKINTIGATNLSKPGRKLVTRGRLEERGIRLDLGDRAIREHLKRSRRRHAKK